MRHNQSDESVRNLQLRQTILDEKSGEVQRNYNYSSLDESFTALAAGLMFGIDYDALEPEEVTDGSHDKQIDIIRIEDDQEESSAHIHILQVKNTTRGFGSGTVIKMGNGLGYVFDRPAADYQRLRNARLVNKIGEIRQLRSEYGTSNLAVSVYLVTRGDAQNLSDEFLQERKNLIDGYANIGFRQFSFQEIGAFELVELLNESESANRRIDADLPIAYDRNRASLVEYAAHGTKALICTVSGVDLAQLVSCSPRDAIFDLNVRPYYGARGNVNSDIAGTCSGPESSRFWFLNNGITMICDSFDLVRDYDNPCVKLESVQIVNGCQTAVTLREAYEGGTLKSDVSVLVRIYATNDPHLAARITLTTNNQNRITDRDLRANDDVQKDFQRVMMENFGYYYERKNKEYSRLRGTERKRVVPNYKAAQAYLAVVRLKPSVARGYLGRIWADHYEEIFGKATAEDLLAAFKIYAYCADRARKVESSDGHEARPQNEISVYGTFHLARIMGHLLLNEQWGPSHRDYLRSWITNLEQDGTMLAKSYDEAMEILLNIRTDNLVENPNPTLYFKATEVQRHIAVALAKI